jgi:hypothetical protein
VVGCVLSSTAIERTGEVPADALSYEDALRMIARYRNDLDGYRLRCSRLEEELRGKLEHEAGAKDIRDVLGHWRKELAPGAKIVPGSERWQKVKIRLRDFEPVELKAVVEGAKRSRWHMAARHRREAAFLFQSVELVEELRDLGLGIEPAKLVNGLTLTRVQEEQLARLKPSEFAALDRCDCGCLRFQHEATRVGENVLCLCSRCDCVDFDDIHQRADRWLAEQRRLPEEQRAVTADAALRNAA